MANNATLPATGTVVETIDEGGVERQVITIGGVGSTTIPEVPLRGFVPVQDTSQTDALTTNMLLQQILLELKILTRQMAELPYELNNSFQYPPTNAMAFSKIDDPEAMRNDPTLFPN